MAKEAEGNDVEINVDAIATNLKSRMSFYNSNTSSYECCIFRVPSTLLNQNPKAYTPNAFSIGPFHHDNMALRHMGKIKLKYLGDFITRCSDKDDKAILRKLTERISKDWEKAHACYEGPINMSMEEFIKVLVLDGCFLIELFRKGHDLKKKAHKGFDNLDPIFNVSNVQRLLKHDLLLLENQIPWFVLEHLFDMIKNVKPLITLVTEFFHNIFSTSVKLHQLSGIDYDRSHGSKHILDLIRNSLFESSRNKNDHAWIPAWEPMPSATRIHEAGIKFKRATSSRTMSEIKFDEGELEIPPLHIHERTESLFRNLICLEQCLPNCGALITPYAILLDNLIDTAQDMEILCKSKAIVNYLDNKDAAQIFNKLYDDIGVRDPYYRDVTQRVISYCELCWPRHRTTLVRDYCKNPWTLISVIFAAILLIFAFLQTFFTIIK